MYRKTAVVGVGESTYYKRGGAKESETAAKCSQSRSLHRVFHRGRPHPLRIRAHSVERETVGQSPHVQHRRNAARS